MSHSQSKDLQLIKLVKSNPILYDHNYPGYSNFNAREVVWHKIGDKLHRQASECKARYANIRDVNRRYLINRRKSGGIKPVYKFYKQLAFLRPFYKGVNSTEDDDENVDDDGIDDEQYNNDSSEVSEDDSEPLQNASLNSISPEREREKKLKYDSNSATEFNNSNGEINNSPELEFSDPVDAFLAGIAPTLKTLSPYHLNLAKSQIFAIVQKHELQQIVKK